VALTLTVRSVNTVSWLTWTASTARVARLPVAGSVAMTLSPTLMFLMGFVRPSAINTAVLAAKLCPTHPPPPLLPRKPPWTAPWSWRSWPAR
jgi:hypothetical protein